MGGGGSTCLRRIDSVSSGSTGPGESCVEPTSQHPLSVDRPRVGMLDADPDDEFTIYLDALQVTRP